MNLQQIQELIATTTAVDFETRAIQPRPHGTPPVPVGVAFRWPDGKQEYLRWGHPNGGNNCAKEDAHRALAMAFKGPCLFHNAKFDLEVAWLHFGLHFPRRWDDTLYLLFLHEAHAPTFALKPSCERLLGKEPVEQDALREWVLANVKEAKKSDWGAFIANAPGDIVAPYAIGDVARTHALFARLAPEILQAQEVAYDRERRLMPHLVQAEQRGIRVDGRLLTQWEGNLTHTLHDADQRIFKLLGKKFNVDSGAELADALEAAGKVKEWELTPTGKRSTARDALLRVCADRELTDLLAYRGTADTMLNTFVGPWLASSAYDGRLHTNWNQVRGINGDGTRTGRIASDHPNLANVPNPTRVATPPDFQPLPELRRALLPEEGEVWVKADYSGQELRIAAHYEDGPLLKLYRDNPDIDQHTNTAAMLAQMLDVAYGTDEEKKRWRGVAKTCAFLIIYGGGVRKLAQQLRCSVDEATEIREAYHKVNPGLKGIIDAVSHRAATYGFVRSLGGRQLKPEPPSLVADPTDDDPSRERLQSFLYKMFNKLVQGSAADQTKEAIIKFCESGSGGTMLAQVYDEIDISTTGAGAAVIALRECMINALPLDTPVVVDIEIGSSWGELT